MTLTWLQTSPTAYTITNDVDPNPSTATKNTAGWVGYAYSTEKLKVQDGAIRLYDIQNTTPNIGCWVALTWYGSDDPTLKTPRNISTVEEGGIYYGGKFETGNVFQFWYNGTNTGDTTTYNGTDLFEIYSDGGYMKFKKNGTPVYTWINAIDQTKELRAYFTGSPSVFTLKANFAGVTPPTTTSTLLPPPPVYVRL